MEDAVAIHPLLCRRSSQNPADLHFFGVYDGHCCSHVAMKCKDRLHEIGVLAKSKDLVAAFGTDDQTNICLEILDKGELQVAGKERDSQLSSQFRDIATIVMQKTINPETQHPYTISMIERLMHEIHFAVDPHSSSKKQSLDVIRELQKHLPIKLSPMRLRLYVPEQKFSSLSEKLNDWTASIVSKDESGSQLSIVSVRHGPLRAQSYLK
ncbi:hypothetical protein TEA_014265 [Camellia sinensis var. sinensis]|uniref:PPM-type phosphatase domain-containing protein n=1 Tax=Camellia sinensis var. sinensis TaxID=542762 RepID=A0A4S4D4T8_CAMSN|nr:hypothetical protein TEA_014265 [Camellia sinensis var. sinensis]